MSDSTLPTMTGNPRKSSAPRRLIRKLRRSIRQRGLNGTIRLAFRKACVLWRGSAAHSSEPEGPGPSFDREYGVDTNGIVETGYYSLDDPAAEYANRYQAVHPDWFRAMMADLPIEYHRYVFVDIGAGKGRALVLASEFPLRRIIGVELIPELEQVARRNLQLFRRHRQRCADLTSVCEDALRFKLPDDPLILFMYNPFERNIFEQFLARVESSWRACPRDILILLVNPVLEPLLTRFPFISRQKSNGRWCVYRTQCPHPDD